MTGRVSGAEMRSAALAESQSCATPHAPSTRPSPEPTGARGSVPGFSARTGRWSRSATCGRMASTAVRYTGASVSGLSLRESLRSIAHGLSAWTDDHSLMLLNDRSSVLKLTSACSGDTETIALSWRKRRCSRGVYLNGSKAKFSMSTPEAAGSRHSAQQGPGTEPCAAARTCPSAAQRSDCR